MKVARRETAEVLVNTSNDGNSSIGSFVPNVSETEQENTSSVKVKSESVVTVRLNKDHSCFIGGVHYVFERNKVYQIPPDVKRVLSVANLLAPL